MEKCRKKKADGHNKLFTPYKLINTMPDNMLGI